MSPIRLIAATVTAVMLLPSAAWAIPLDAPITEVASAHVRAERDVSWVPDAGCDLVTAEAVGKRHPDARQLVLLTTQAFGDTVGEAAVVVRRLDGSWKCQTDTVPARFGRTGTRPLLLRRSGDGTTPAGVFPLGETIAWDGQRVNVFGNRADPGVRNGIGYRSVRPEDCWGATPNDADYNHLVSDRGCQGPEDEWLERFGDVYAHAALIGANMDPVSGDQPGETPYAAAIFLHRHSYVDRTAGSGATRPTSGCVSLSLDDLVDAINLLDPFLQPQFAIGPVDWLRAGG